MNNLVIETLLHIGDMPKFVMTVVSNLGTVQPINNATTMQFLFEKPDGTSAVQDAEFVTDGLDGLMQYATESGDIDMTGVWLVQGKVVLPEGLFYSKEKLRFRVLSIVGGS